MVLRPKFGQALLGVRTQVDDLISRQQVQVRFVGQLDHRRGATPPHVILVQLAEHVRALVEVGEQNRKRLLAAPVQTQADHQLVDQAVLLPLVHERVVGEVEDHVLLEQLGGHVLVPGRLRVHAIPDRRIEVRTCRERVWLDFHTDFTEFTD